MGATADLYSALFLVIGGLASNLTLILTTRYLFRTQKSSAITERLEILKLRFAARKRLAWVMTFVGVLWLLQLVLEQTESSGHFFG